MLIPLADIILLYERIQEQVNISYVSLVIFTGLDIDSLCTLRILSNFFKSESIHFKVYPVSTYTELSLRIEESRDYEQVKLFCFINCGGVVDLTEYWFVKRVQVLLFDVNKPIHHRNLASPDIKVIDDGCSGLDKCPKEEEIAKFEEFDEYVYDERESDSDEELSPKRKSQVLYRQKIRNQRDLLRNKIDSYYGKQFFGLPSSYSAYRLVRDLNKAHNDYLWLGIVGLTSMFLEQKIVKEQFESVSMFFRSEMIRMNPQTAEKREKGEISTKKGYQFILLDHWSLYDSIMNSPYMITKLRLWENKGTEKLYEFLAQVSISIRDAKQLYRFLPRDTQIKLQNNIFEMADRFNLLDVAFLSFIRQVDYSDTYMASDYYCMLTAALQRPKATKMTLVELSDYRITCFWEAYDLFSANHLKVIQHISLYKSMITTITTEARSLIQRECVCTIASLSFANIKNDSEDHRIFEHPSVLIRLAYLLMWIQAQRRKSKGHKPFIASLMDTDTKICTVVGVMMEQKNSFSRRFNETALKLKIDVRHDNFMGNIMVLPTESLMDFIREMSGIGGA